MNTQQSYEQTDSCATPNESTAQNSQQSAESNPQTAQNEGQQSRFSSEEEYEQWANTFEDEFFMEVAHHRGATEYIKSALDKCRDFFEATDPVPALLNICEMYMGQHGSLHSGQVLQVRQLVNICAWLTDLREDIDCIRNETKDFESNNPVA